MQLSTFLVALAGVVCALVSALRCRRARRALAVVGEQFEQRVADRTVELADDRSRLIEAQHLGRVGSWEWDVTHDRIAWSDELYRIYDLRQHEVPPSFEVYLSLVHPDDRDQVVALIKQALVEGGRLEFEHRIRRQDGSETVLECRGMCTQDATGAVVHMTGTAQDVTAQRAQASQLAAARERFQLAFDSALIGMALIAEDGTFIQANPALCRMLGFGNDELQVRTESDVSHPEDRTGGKSLVANLAGAHTYTTEKRYLRSDGGVVWGLATAASLGGESAESILNVSDITERKEAEAALIHQTLHDPLTGLPNRTLLNDRLEQAMARSHRAGSRLALLFLDLDRFKLINDSMGHSLGDQLLVEVARRLSAIARESDTVARLGGDEFVVLLEDVDSEAEAMKVAERVQEVVARAYRVDGVEIVSSASVGVAVSDPGSGSQTAEQILRAADTAMYRAKDAGRGRSELFDDTLSARAMARVQTERVLRRALETGGVIVHYQPIVDATSGEIVGAEALARLVDPDGGLIPPNDFIPVAEECGLITALGSQVLASTCAQLAIWRRTLGRRAPRRVTVNVSARHLGSPAILAEVKGLLAKHRLPHGSLAIELTETVLMEATPATMLNLGELKAMGLSLGIDDFGTGYSSLTYLRRFPVDFVKIDRDFVAGLGTDVEDEAIVRAVIGLGRTMGLTTVAEGVETSEQLTMLHDLGCDLAQGYLFSPPVPPDDFESLARALVKISA